MKAFVRDEFGGPEVLEIRDVPVPEPGPGQVVVKVRASSVQPWDWHNLRGEPRVARLMGGVGRRRPLYPVLGADLAGDVTAVGPDVTTVGVGDAVYAMPLGGGFAEYALVDETALAPKPENFSYEEAAAVPLSALTALMALRDDGNLTEGQSVLVTGASGGVGIFTVQLAKALGASQVTAVSGPHAADLLTSLGADTIIDRTKDDFTRTATPHDLLIDIAGAHSARATRRALTPKGALVVVGGPGGRWISPVNHVISAMALAPFISQRVALTDVTASKTIAADLAFLTSTNLKPILDRTYPFPDLPAALQAQEHTSTTGKLVLTF
ncbi:NAD(P)-dependent alcohol dehydrogenase [Actinocorallia sp. A-T 12471]|uniref:NAD(P)-dependent alcohol dehydrogenase n=1 Tax=Actinocorallia sp. A-T 12471 TaxID=3089813 RepID=UPI0029D17623|nr:NAD(P)-dependent alcohol dehydrogenase [Actinocorallia sp. A-T 12471]MDX6744164.1 NAD(P)-dependent alcohol dehydrogenase [Actinocorallia sp. A-T 12471]